MSTKIDALGILHEAPYIMPPMRNDSLVHFFHQKEGVKGDVGYVQDNEYHKLLQAYISLYDSARRVSRELLELTPDTQPTKETE